jgi:hypothetical protein
MNPIEESGENGDDVRKRMLRWKARVDSVQSITITKSATLSGVPMIQEGAATKFLRGLGQQGEIMQVRAEMD